MSTEVRMATLPTCNFCGEVAAYDSVVNFQGRRTWAYTCEEHFASFGSGRLGTGIGQRLVQA